MVYPALLPLMRTLRLPAVDWTEAPADLNGLVHFAERRNLVSERVPSHFNWALWWFIGWKGHGVKGCSLCLICLCSEGLGKITKTTVRVVCLRAEALEPARVERIKILKQSNTTCLFYLLNSHGRNVSTAVRGCDCKITSSNCGVSPHP